ncbi:DoxX family protein [Aestuariivirga sp. YIM B02566]|uniref:DoxX family protein n=1 Tax=Taklimakanibacter albus TaxID=2800327 RepID=A0ACC5QZS2_9HYPH|nr:DoxX family protein [Aestuariivirga sp. YIM B02566]MBK1865817.1 DoxX family protein [Aestuariivirga sp. YIM B02566]
MTEDTEVSRKVWAGRIITGLVVAYLLFDSILRVLKLDAAVGGFERLGYPESLVVPVGLVELAGVILYVFPRSAVLGAILLTGHLGGATAAILRLENPWFLLPVGLGALLWGGLYLRDDKVNALFPLRR